jgi:hypothetical protein
MELTQEQILNIILEEYAAVKEIYKAKGESPEERAARMAQKGTKALNTMDKPARSDGQTPEEKAAAKLKSTALTFLRLMKMGQKVPPMSDELAAEVKRLKDMNINLEEEK